MTDTPNIRCWIITEQGLTGTQNQCLGVAQALNLTAQIKEIKLRRPWKTFSPYIAFEHKNTFIPPLAPTWPDLVIAGGRKAIAACRYIKKKSPTTFTTFLQNPTACHSIFDLIAAPTHDRITGDNVIQTIGAPNLITPQILALEDTSKFNNLPAPRIALLLGGNSRTHTLTDAIMDKLITQLQSLDASFMITPSRRTDPHHIEKLKAANLNAYIWNGHKTNPYKKILAAADTILVTGDSVSMLSDAASTGKPTYIVTLEGQSPKFNMLYETFQQKNIARVFEGKLESWNYTHLTDAKTVADEIKKRMELKS